MNLLNKLLNSIYPACVVYACFLAPAAEIIAILLAAGICFLLALLVLQVAAVAVLICGDACRGCTGGEA